MSTRYQKWNLSWKGVSKSGLNTACEDFEIEPKDDKREEKEKLEKNTLKFILSYLENESLTSHFGFPQFPSDIFFTGFVPLSLDNITFSCKFGESQSCPTFEEDAVQGTLQYNIRLQ